MISGNVANGVYISDPGTVGNVVEGDDIGTDDTGSNRVGNGVGVYIGNGATDNTIGGTSAAASDVIAANVDGIVITGSGTSNNLVELCEIGTNASSSTSLGNTNDGVLIEGSASSNVITGGSFIADDGNNGVELDSGTSDNTIEGDFIVGNTNDGVLDEGTGNSEPNDFFFANGKAPIGT